MLKAYILSSIIVILSAAIIYHSINYNLNFLLPWSFAGLFFLLWRRSIHKPSKPKKKLKITKIKKLL